jgi:hypothetical protein
MPAEAVLSLPNAAMAVYSGDDLDVHQSAKIIRRTGGRCGADGIGKAC